jgi:hypothetical protein
VSHRKGRPTRTSRSSTPNGQDILDDLRARLKATRFAPDVGNDNEVYELSTRYLRPLVEFWADGFDWRAAEARLNRFTHHGTSRELIGFVAVLLAAERRTACASSHSDPAAFTD